MRFIRKNGRIIPIRESTDVRDRASAGAAKGVVPGAVAMGGLWHLGSKSMGKPSNLLGTAFWGHKGAVAGGVAGALVGAAAIRKAPPMSEKGKSTAKQAFKTSLGLSLLGTAGRLARPFTKGRANKVALAANLAGFAGGTAAPFAFALKAPRGERSRVFAAGAAADILGVNVLRAGGPLARNRKRLGLRRFG